MKKIYCNNCKWNRKTPFDPDNIDAFGWTRECHHCSNIELYDTAKGKRTKFLYSFAYKNENNNCKFFKQRWTPIL